MMWMFMIHIHIICSCLNFYALEQKKKEHFQHSALADPNKWQLYTQPSIISIVPTLFQLTLACGTRNIQIFMEKLQYHNVKILYCK